MPMKYDVVVIGGGSAGYVAGSVLARNGKKVLVVEKDRFGGVCVRSGCAPSIFLYDASFFLTRFTELGNYKGISIDVKAKDPFKKRNEVVDYLSTAGEKLVEDAGADVIKGEARISGNSSLLIDGKGVEFDRVVIATGSSPSLPCIKGVEQGITEDEAVNLSFTPTDMVVIGGGFAGVEIAQFYARLGSTVSLITRGRILKCLSEDARNAILTSLEWDGVKVIENCEPREQDGKVVKATCGELKGEVTVYATGRKPNFPVGLNLLDVNYNSRGIVTDQSMRTSNPKVWAAGDVVDKERKVAHSAMMEGFISSLNILGRELRIDRLPVPHVIYTDPQVAVVGDVNLATSFRRFPMNASTRAIIYGLTEGYTKLGIDKENRVVYGEVVSNNAEEIVNLLVLAIKLRIKVEELALLPLVHPSVSEVISNAARAFLNLDVDVYREKR